MARRTDNRHERGKKSREEEVVGREEVLCTTARHKSRKGKRKSGLKSSVSRELTQEKTGRTNK